MVADVDDGNKAAGLGALRQMKSTEPPLYLTPSPELSKAARLASKYLFSAISPHAPKSPFNQLLTEGFDTEQIWQQIDLQAQPLLSSLRRYVRNFERNPEEIERQFNFGRGRGKEKNVHEKGETRGDEGAGSESDGIEDAVDDDDEEEEEEDEEEEEGEEFSDEDNAEMDGHDEENAKGVEDKFLKIKELEEYLVEDEAREYGLKNDKKSKRKRDEDEDEDGEDEDEEGEGENEDEVWILSSVKCLGIDMIGSRIFR